MKLRDCLIKRAEDGFWLRHTTSSYRVRLNEVALQRIRDMLSRTGPCEMSADERMIFDKLSRHGIICGDDEPVGTRELTVRDNSLLESLELELSGTCNLRCRHCFADLSGRLMSRETLDKILRGADELGPVSLILNGGEPLLNPLFHEAVKEARKRDLRAVIMTNATLVTPEISCFLGESRVAKVIVSLDFFEDSHDVIRGPGAFRKTVKGIGRLVADKVPVFITAMVRDETVPQVEDFKKFCLEGLGAAGVRLSAVMPIGRAASAYEGLGLSDGSLRKLRGSGQLSEESDGRPARAGMPRLPCTAGIEQCFVGADGSVYACHYFQNLKEPLGDLSASSLAEIYRKAQSESITARFDGGKLRACADCAVFAECRGGCRARARLLGGSFYAPDPFACRLRPTAGPEACV